MVINYVTKNYAKAESARQFFENFGIRINQIKMDTVEIQSDKIEEIAKFSAEYASKKLNLPVLKNDTGFFVEALDGFPGAYSHFVEDKIGYEGLLKLMEGKENRKAYFLEVFALSFQNGETKLFTCKTYGTLALTGQGDFGWGWDHIFIPDGETNVLACFDDAERFKKWNNDGFNQILNYLKNEIM